MIERAFGASVKGLYHKKNKIPNQDHYLICNSKKYTLAVVCDGMGSKKYSHVGSKCLCKIINKEVKQELKKGQFNVKALLNNIQNKWMKNISPFTPKTCDTTCLFCIIGDKSIISCQLGDGIIAINSDNDLSVVKYKEDDFVNETIGIGKSNYKDWMIKMFLKENKNYEILIATDGISEDLKSNTLLEFINTVSHNTKGKHKQNRFLKKMISNWPNRFSDDDRTVVVIK